MNEYTIDEYGFRRDEYGSILEEDMKKAIELADNIDDIATLRSIIENDMVNACMECSMLLSEKEDEYNF